MTDTRELTNRIRGAGYTFEEVAEKLGITRQALGNKINNKAEFKQGEISTLQQMLKLNLTATNAIFFNVR